MKNKRNPQIKDAILTLDDLFVDLYNYDGQSLYLKDFNLTFVNYLKASFFSVNGSFNSPLLTRAARASHPFIFTLHRIFENKALTKPHILEVEAMLKKHPLYPLKNFLLLFTKHKKGSDTFKNALIRNFKRNDFLTKLWFLKYNVSGLEKEKTTLTHDLSRQNVTYATYKMLLNEASAKPSEKTLLQLIDLTIRQNFVKDDTSMSRLYLDVADKLKDNTLKIKILIAATKKKYYEALIPLASAYLSARELGKERLLEAYRYLVIAEFLEVPGVKKLYIEYKHALKDIY